MEMKTPRLPDHFFKVRSSNRGVNPEPKSSGQIGGFSNASGAVSTSSESNAKPDQNRSPPSRGVPAQTGRFDVAPPVTGSWESIAADGWAVPLWCLRRPVESARRQLFGNSVVWQPCSMRRRSRATGPHQMRTDGEQRTRMLCRLVLLPTRHLTQDGNSATKWMSRKNQ